MCLLNKKHRSRKAHLFLSVHKSVAEPYSRAIFYGGWAPALILFDKKNRCCKNSCLLNYCRNIFSSYTFTCIQSVMTNEAIKIYEKSKMFLLLCCSNYKLYSPLA